MSKQTDRRTRPDRALVWCKIEQIFPGRDPRRILAILDGYGSESPERDRDRVQLAILKLCEERSLRDPLPLVSAAKADPRDILAAAEYPRQSTAPPGHPDTAALRQADRADYLAWLKRGATFRQPAAPSCGE